MMLYGSKRLSAREILTDPVLFLAFGFGSGLARKAPGTLGTLAAVPFYWLLVNYLSPLMYSVVTIVVVVGGIGVCGKAAEKLGDHDFRGIVWDEIAGYLIALGFVPFSWEAAALGFALFRCFDIVKPWPINWVDKNVHGGLGIMLDDVLAGTFAGALLYLVYLG